MQGTLLVFLGAGIGGALRHATNVTAARLLGSWFPFGTLVINVVGSFAMGLVAGWLAFRTEAGWAQSFRLFVATGILGGYTTFSAFSLDTVLLWESGEPVGAGLYILLSVLASVGALTAGLALVRAMS